MAQLLIINCFYAESATLVNPYTPVKYYDVFFCVQLAGTQDCCIYHTYEMEDVTYAAEQKYCA